MYLYELHSHTNIGSKCGKSSPAEMVEFYRSHGYAGMVITDHFFRGNTLPDTTQPWADYVAEYAKGYYEAKKAAEGLDFDVFFGVEEKLKVSDEYLILGLDPDWYAAHPEIGTTFGHEFFEMIHKAGGFVIHAHPYRERDYMKARTIMLFPDDEDAVEVYNTANPIEHNRLAYEYALKTGKPMTGGSDNHSNAEKETLGGISLPRRVSTVEELIDAIKKRENEVIGIEKVKAAPLGEPTFTVEIISK